MKNKPSRKFLLLKPIVIDMEKCRARVEKVYNKKEKKMLLGLYDLFEAGEFEKAYKRLSHWSGLHKEYLDCEIADVFQGMGLFGEAVYTVEQCHNEIHKYEKKWKINGN